MRLVSITPVHLPVLSLFLPLPSHSPVIRPSLSLPACVWGLCLCASKCVSLSMCLCVAYSRINEMQPKEELQDGPPELLFLHAGHTSRVSDICWSKP